MTPDQKAEITAIIEKQNDAVRALTSAKATDPQSEMDFIEKALDIRISARNEMRALLTPEQRKKYDHTPQILGGGQTQDSAARVARLDAEVGLTADQKKLAAAIYDDEYEELLVFTPEERTAKGQEARQTSQRLIRAMLTPAQQQNLESHRQTEAKRNTEERKELESLLKSSAAVTALVGPIKRFEPTTGLISDFGQGRSGKTTYKLIGERGVEQLTVYWEKNSAELPMKITKLAGPNGEAIQP